MATLFGRHLHIPDEALRLLALGGLLHDNGKAMLPLNLLNTARRLTNEEFAQMKTHALTGYEAIKDATGLSRPPSNWPCWNIMSDLTVQVTLMVRKARKSLLSGV